MLLTKSVFNAALNACSGASSNKIWSNLVPRSLVDEADKRSGYIHIYIHKLYFNSNLQSNYIELIFPEHEIKSGQLSVWESLVMTYPNYGALSIQQNLPVGNSTCQTTCPVAQTRPKPPFVWLLFL